MLTVDFEEWYHPEYVKDKITEDRSDRAPEDLRETLDLLEKHELNATFFVVGEIAQKNPYLINQITQSGHEVSFHGFDHEPLWEKNAEKLRLEIGKFQTLLDRSCIGFRAPSFSLDNSTSWALDVLAESGFKYDSSIFPMRTLLYGVKGAPTSPYRPSRKNICIEDQESVLWEFPLHVYSASLFKLPMAGGFYLRFFPLRLVKKSIKKANREGRPVVLFVHTWELAHEVPKLRLGPYKSFVTYHNLEKVASKLEQLFSQFEFTSIRNYMKEKGL